MSQADKLLALLSDGLPHRTDEIAELVYGGSHLGLSRIGARVYDLKKKRYDINGWKDKETPSLYWYQLTLAKSRDAFANPANSALSRMGGEGAAQGIFNYLTDNDPWRFR